jgi:hypothetical protein
MIVACTQVHVTFQATIFASDNQYHFGVSFVPHDAKNYDRACFLQNTDKLNVLFLVKSRSEFNNNGDLYVISRRIRRDSTSSDDSLVL